MSGKLGLFAGFGVELEYMIVDRETLDVRPICDKLIEAVAGEPIPEIEFERTAWSNELVLHVVEMKTNGPAPTLSGLARVFQEDVARIDTLLERFGAMLLPTAMHPWMNPERETRIWPHENGPIYAAYNRIFDCRGHGWSNLQSTHINLPFANDTEFGRLHAAIRILLPLLPALAASSPIVEMSVTGTSDNRLGYYQGNQKKLPVVAGQVVPEAVYTEADYDREIFAPIRTAIAPYDPEGLLEHQFLNSRGAIARFERGAIEIRVLDIQEYPGADLAILALIVEVLKALVSDRWSDESARRTMDTGKLARIFRATVDLGEEYEITDPEYLSHFGCEAPVTAGELWRKLHGELAVEEEFRGHLDFILENGNLSRRILKAVGGAMEAERVREVYAQLARCLVAGQGFKA